MTAAQAAQRLGIKPATLFAYVSRGVLGRSKSADGRGSLFDPAEVERLAQRGRPRRPAGVADITVKSAITVITADNLRYRGLDATRLAVSHTFEEVAALLWTGELPSTRTTARPAAGPAWRATAAAMAAGRTAQTGLPAGILPLERLQVIGLRSQRPTRCGSSSISRPCSRPGGASSPAWWIACPGRTRPVQQGRPRAGRSVRADRGTPLVAALRPAGQPRAAARGVPGAGAPGRPRARRLHAGRTGRGLGARGPVRSGRHRAGRDERARTAGWIAHAVEAYAADGPMRPRAIYTGRLAADLLLRDLAAATVGGRGQG